MLRIHCPYCGPRDENEFSCGGEAHIERPKEPDLISDAEWGEYLFVKNNPQGYLEERWCHTYGCRKWFNVSRDTRSHTISRIYKMGVSAENHKPENGED